MYYERYFRRECIINLKNDFGLIPRHFSRKCDSLECFETFNNNQVLVYVVWIFCHNYHIIDSHFKPHFSTSLLLKEVSIKI